MAYFIILAEQRGQERPRTCDEPASVRISDVSGQGHRSKLAGFRRAAGLTQKQLGENVGVSARVIAYYEGETEYPPGHLIEPLARALNVSTDELLGIRNVKQRLSVPWAGPFTRAVVKCRRLRHCIWQGDLGQKR